VTLEKVRHQDQLLATLVLLDNIQKGAPHALHVPLDILRAQGLLHAQFVLLESIQWQEILYVAHALLVKRLNLDGAAIDASC
jgi:hypothetical protein